MKREEIIVAAQLLTGMKDAISKMEELKKKKDTDGVMMIKKEILKFQSELSKLL